MQRAVSASILILAALGIGMALAHFRPWKEGPRDEGRLGEEGGVLERVLLEGEEPAPTGGEEAGIQEERKKARMPAPGKGRAGGRDSGKAPESIGRRSPPPKGAVIFPDGTWLPPLNGVPGVDQPYPWPADRPWSPVVAIRTGDGGLQWYLHADGSTGSTQMTRITEPGKEPRFEPVIAIGNPRDTKPVRIPGLGAEGGK